MRASLPGLTTGGCRSRPGRARGRRARRRWRAAGCRAGAADAGAAGRERRAPEQPSQRQLQSRERRQRMGREGGGPLPLGEMGEGAGDAATRAGEMEEAPAEADRAGRIAWTAPRHGGWRARRAPTSPANTQSPARRLPRSRSLPVHHSLEDAMPPMKKTQSTTRTNQIVPMIPRDHPGLGDTLARGGGAPFPDGPELLVAEVPGDRAPAGDSRTGSRTPKDEGRDRLGAGGLGLSGIRYGHLASPLMNRCRSDRRTR